LCTSLYTWPIAVEAELIADRDNFVKGVAATVTKSVRLSVERGSGPKFARPAFRWPSPQATSFAPLVVIDGQTVYEVAGGVPKSGGQDADLDRCVNGFVLNRPLRVASANVRRASRAPIHNLG